MMRALEGGATAGGGVDSSLAEDGMWGNLSVDGAHISFSECHSEMAFTLLYKVHLITASQSIS